MSERYYNHLNSLLKDLKVEAELCLASEEILTTEKQLDDYEEKLVMFKDRVCAVHKKMEDNDKIDKQTCSRSVLNEIICNDDMTVGLISRLATRIRKVQQKQEVLKTRINTSLPYHVLAGINNCVPNN